MTTSIFKCRRLPNYPATTSHVYGSGSNSEHLIRVSLSNPHLSYRLTHHVQKTSGPFPTRDYYALAGIFRSTPAGLARRMGPGLRPAGMLPTLVGDFPQWMIATDTTQLHGADEADRIRDESIRLRGVDQPIAGLLTDLKRQGLLDDTLVVWTGEFRRTPMGQRQGAAKNKPPGRGHNPFGWSLLLAGGGIKRGFVHSATDEFGYTSVQGRVHIHDLHATILHLMGLDHERLTYQYGGRNYRLTDVYGNVVHDILA